MRCSTPATAAAPSPPVSGKAAVGVVGSAHAASMFGVSGCSSLTCSAERVPSWPRQSDSSSSTGSGGVCMAHANCTASARQRSSPHSCASAGELEVADAQRSRWKGAPTSASGSSLP